MPTVKVFAGSTGIVPGFGNGAAVTFPNGGFMASALQSDGKLVITGTSNSSFMTVRYNSNGSLDSSFNKTGIVITRFGNNASAQSVAIQKDGRIVVGGYTDVTSGTHGQILELFLAMARYNTNGSLDSSFDGDGVIGPSNGISGFAYQVALLSNQKIVVATKNGTRIRFNTDGSRDLTSPDQPFELTLSLAFSYIASIAIQSDNKIIELRSDSNLVLVRYNPNGTPDSSFNGTGIVTTDFGGFETASSIAIQADGKLVVTGDTRADVSSQQRRSVLARYNTDGTLDQSFDGDGKVTAEFDANATFPDYGNTPFPNGSVVIQNDGKIVASRGALITRYNTNGSPDQSFYSAGKQFLNAGVIIVASLIIENNLYLTGNASNAGYLYAMTLDNSVRSGLNYRYYEGEWNTLPEFNSLTPLQTGTTANPDIGGRPAGKNDRFAFVWEGYINIQTPGDYTFETLSDDGSKFYFNTFYSPAAQALVNNDGVHASTSVKGSVSITAAGLYPVSITYFERDGGETMEVYWTGPGIARQRVPDAVFSLKAIDITLPSAPSNMRLVYKGRKLARLDWENATDNIGVSAYEVYGNGVLLYTTTQSFVTAENLTPNTSYTFTVKAVDAAGNKSDYGNAVSFTTASSGLNYKFYTNVPYGLAGLQGLNVSKSGVTNNVDISIRPVINENYAFLWQGYINIPAPGIYTFETVSDDGSRLYFNTPFSDVADPFINNFDNNGLHAPLSVSRTISIPSAGLYPIAITYHQYGGGQLMQLYWQGPGISRQLVPDDAFTNDSSPGFLVNGLNYKYYEGSWTTLPDLSSLTPVKSGQSSNVDLSVRTPGRNDNFAFVWNGYITLPEPGIYTFETNSDDGSRFYFNSLYGPTAVSTVNNDGLHAATSAKTTIVAYVAGTYPIAISFFENTGDEKMEVYWTGPNIARQLIPSEVLSPNPPLEIERLSYKYYQGAWNALPDFSTLTPVRTGTSANVDISVRPAQWNDIFGFVWQGYIYIPSAGTYVFETVSDDGSKLYLNNSPGVIADVDNDGVHAAKSASATIITGAGIYPITITYFEQYGGEKMEVYWSGPGIPRQRIPNEAFVLVKPEALPLMPALTNAITQQSGTVSLITPTPEMANRRSVYPNPFDESVTIDFNNPASMNDITIGIYDLNGRRVFMKYAGRLPAGNNIIKMNLNSIKIKDGVYIIQIQKNGIVWKTEKVVKMKK